jgi:phosphate-selective porin OprO/OprP
MRNSFLRQFTATMLAMPAVLPATKADELGQLRDQLQILEQKILVLERKQELEAEAAAAAANRTATVTVSDRGFVLASADGTNSIRLRGLVQLDARHFFGDDAIVNNALVLRRARMIFDGRLSRDYSFQLATDFGGSGVSLLDACLNYTYANGLKFRFGRFKSPIGLEQLQSDTWTFFTERSIATNLVPNRDVGIQAWGDLLDGRVSYAAGVFNGVADGASSTNTDFDSGKDLVGRVTVTPFKNTAGSPLQGLNLGLAASIGREQTAAGRTAGYRTDGQQMFFAYNSSVIADGRSWRFTPQLDYRDGSFGLLGEYIRSTVNVRPGATGGKAELQNQGWQLAAGYVLTGEDSAYDGVVPQSRFDRSAGTWGAFELTARVARLEVDDAAFPAFASAASNASEATSIGVGLNWYLSNTVSFKIDHYQTRFGFNSAAPLVSTAPALRQDEKVVITRFQIGF